MTRAERASPSGREREGERALPAPAPPRDEDGAEMWAATLDGRLLLRRCDSCGTVIWYPRPICPDCHSTSTSWFDATGRGHVYSFTVVRRARGPFAGSVPYVLAYVELDEGPRVMTNVVDCDPDQVRIGLPVEVVFHDTGDGAALYRFRPRPPQR